MRRLLVGFVVAAMLIAGFRHATSVSAVTYGTGWNLVSGSQGSTLIGATGSLYTLQPGDTDYEVLPVTSALNAGWGYWAYFPSGGSLQPAASGTTYTTTLSPGQYVMLGNPSTTGAATITGADTALIYTPSGGYQVSTNIPPGQGAWVQATGVVTLLAVAASVTSPSAQPQPIVPSTAPTLTTDAGLKAVALSAADLPGYTLHGEHPIGTSWVASYTALWTSAGAGPATFVSDFLETDSTLSDAHTSYLTWGSVIQGDRANYSIQIVAIAGVGEEAESITYRWIGSTTAHVFHEYGVVFRRALTTVYIEATDLSVTDPLSVALSYARTIDGRITGSAPSPAPQGSATVASQPAPTAHLLQTSGSGTTSTATFSADTGVVNVCVQASGRSSTGLYGPSVSIVAYTASGQINSFPFNFDTGGCRTIRPDDGPGRYYFDVIATSWTTWTLTVDPAPIGSADAPTQVEELVRSAMSR